MIEIGGYLELELPKLEEYHSNAHRLNIARNALEYIIRTEKVEKIYLPIYSCISILEPLSRLNIDYSFYNIDDEFNPIFNFFNLKKNDWFLYVNYYGLNSKVVKNLFKKHINLIIDNSQAFFEKPMPETLTFYSPRKFFGIPDGAYLYSSKNLQLESDSSLNRFEPLLGRIDVDAESYFESYKEQNKMLSNQNLKRMSSLTTRILESIDYEYVRSKRRMNFEFLHQSLGKLNKMNFEISDSAVPLGYPFLLNNGHELKRNLINNKIFIPTFWPKIKENCTKGSFEAKLIKDLVFLPIDQRYSAEHMERIISVIKNNICEG